MCPIFFPAKLVSHLSQSFLYSVIISTAARLEKEIAVRPTLTAWMDTAAECSGGWVSSILSNADTIVEAFCRAVALTQGNIFHGLPKTILALKETITRINRSASAILFPL